MMHIFHFGDAVVLTKFLPDAVNFSFFFFTIVMSQRAAGSLVLVVKRAPQPGFGRAL